MLGALIRAYRNEHRYGVREMAKLIGISHATLSRIERGATCDSDTAFRVVLWALSPQGQKP
jgi:DNA-binding XRE family transcriptional regulator